MVEKRRMVTNAASSVVQIVVSGVTLIILYRYLLDTIGVAHLGVWSLVLATSSMIQVANFGLTGSIVKHIAECDAKGDTQSLVVAVETAAITVASVSLLFIVCAYPVATYYLAFAVDDQLYQEARAILPLALGAFVVMMVTSIYQSGLYGCQLIVQRNGLLIAESISHAMLCVFLAPRYGLLGLAYARVAQNLMTLAASAAFLKRTVSALSFIPYRWDKKQFEQMIGYATHFQLISVLALLSDPITKACLSRWGGVSMVGYYEMANKFVQLFRSLIVNANQVLVPEFAKLKELRPQKVAELYLQSTRLVTYLAIPGFGLLGICAPLVSELWVGRYEPALVWSIILLSLGWLANTLAVPAYFACLGVGEMRINVISHAIMALLNGLLAFSFGRIFGGFGVVAAWAISLAIGGLLLNILYCSRSSIAFRRLVLADDWKLGGCFITGLVATSIGWQALPSTWEVILPTLHAPSAWGPILTSAMTILAYLAIMSVPMWHHSTRAELQRWLARPLAGER
ncbi:MAG: hypothetical protein E8D40_07880 [Nitrospira sp.]|nr:MAG: hypothetical protein E8D40_07880 [Nitrospira sp.]